MDDVHRSHLGVCGHGEQTEQTLGLKINIIVSRLRVKACRAGAGGKPPFPDPRGSVGNGSKIPGRAISGNIP
ncbi:MAG: hypothetical protein QNI97_02080 [Desulfobacterales bacterium]|nr:hypothetical protein [Desulfobacterales bacterium]